MSRMDIFLMLAKVVSNMNKSTRAKKVCSGRVFEGPNVSMERVSKSDIMYPLWSFNLGSVNVGSCLRSEIKPGRYFWNMTVQYDQKGYS